MYVCVYIYIYIYTCICIYQLIVLKVLFDGHRYEGSVRVQVIVRQAYD